MRKTGLFIISMLLVFSGVYAQDYRTSSSGNWANTAIWRDSAIPSTDLSTYIQHAVVVDSSVGNVAGLTVGLLNVGTLTITNGGSLTAEGELSIGYNNAAFQAGILNVYGGTISTAATKNWRLTGSSGTQHLNIYGDAGTLHSGGELWVNENSGITWDFNGGDAVSYIDVDEYLYDSTAGWNQDIVNGTYTVDFANFSGAAGTYTNVLFHQSGGYNRAFSLANILQSTNTSGKVTDVVFHSDTVAKTVYMTFDTVPEPATIGLFAFAAAGLLAFRRTR